MKAREQREGRAVQREMKARREGCTKGGGESAGWSGRIKEQNGKEVEINEEIKGNG